MFASLFFPIDALSISKSLPLTTMNSYLALDITVKKSLNKNKIENNKPMLTFYTEIEQDGTGHDVDSLQPLVRVP